MRKVFLSTVILNNINYSAPTKHASRDLDLGEKQFIFPISFLLDSNISADDEILIITGMSQTDTPKENYKHLESEMKEILEAHHAKAEFVVLDELAADLDEDRELMDALSFSTFMKQVSDLIQDGDEIYTDMTYGLKSYTLAMFVALNYVVKACKDVEIKQMIYVQFYRGDKTKPSSADIIDITSLFRINSIVNEAKPGQKAELDQLLSFMIG